MIKTKLIILLSILILSSCALSPGMDMKLSSSKGETFTYVDNDKNNKIIVKELSLDYLKEIGDQKQPYKIGIGDKLSVTVWGLSDIFPMASVGLEQSLRVVNTDGSMYFPYVGTINVVGRTQVEVRRQLTERLSKYFNEPQLDVSIAKFESQKVYILGEVARPQKLPITETPLTLADALGLVNGLNNNTSDASEVFVIRQSSGINEAIIIRANLSSPSSLILAGEFVLKPQDIVYVNASTTSQWNRVISQFFPFSSFLNSVDNLINND